MSSVPLLCLLLLTAADRRFGTRLSIVLLRVFGFLSRVTAVGFVDFFNPEVDTRLFASRVFETRVEDLRVIVGSAEVRVGTP